VVWEGDDVQPTDESTIASGTRRDQLAKWLADRDGRCVWSVLVDTRRGSSSSRPWTLDGWIVNGQVLIVQLHPDGGWEIFTACTSNKISETLADAERRLGLRDAD
jgi:hypothetical protein